MPCYHPLRAYRQADGSVQFYEKTGRIARDDFSRGTVGNLLLPCGQCIGCRIERASDWATRCMHENRMHKVSSFVTLTYNDENLPKRGELVYRDYQLFMKRLRFEYGKRIRFYMAGEYGEQNWRPHYHALLFGYRPDDLKYFKQGVTKENLFTSKSLDRLWGLGFVVVGDVTYQSANYVARYCLKKVTGPLAESHYARADADGVYTLPPEFCQMSRKPGIGATYIERYSRDVYQSDSVIVNGKERGVPRFYDKWFAEKFPDEFAEIQKRRYDSAQVFNNAWPAERTWQRTEVKEEVAAARLQYKQRNNITNS